MNVLKIKWIVCIATFCTHFLLLPPATYADEANSESSPHHTLHSTFTNQDYRLWVLLPKQYSDNDSAQYPVIYLLDAESSNLTLLKVLYGSLDNNPSIPNFILVAIGFESDAEHQGLRSAQFTPTSNEAFDQRNISALLKNAGEDSIDDSPLIARWRSGQADAFSNTLAQTIMPFVSKQYRTNGENALMGHSFGGLFAAHVLFSTADVFDKYLLSSPSLWWQHREMLAVEAKYAEAHRDLNAKVFVSVGAQESTDMVEPFRPFVATLQQRHYPTLQLQSAIIPDTNHMSVIPAAFSAGIRYLLTE